jgi:hypothetical protein
MAAQNQIGSQSSDNWQGNLQSWSQPDTIPNGITPTPQESLGANLAGVRDVDWDPYNTGIEGYLPLNVGSTNQLLHLSTTAQVEEPSTSLRQQQPSHEWPKSRKNLRGTLKILSLNIKGRGADSIKNAKHKWHEVAKKITNNNIGVCFLQETHVSDEQAEELQTFFSSKFKIFTSYDPDTRCRKK